MTSPTKAAWLIEQLKRDDLPPEKRKRYKNQLKMQHSSAHPKAGEAAQRQRFYKPDAWKRISRRRKLAQASRRRNRRG